MPRVIRFLQAWMNRDEAIATSLGRAPGPEDDTAAQAERWETARRLLDARPVYQLGAPQVENLPAGLAEEASAFGQRADVIAMLHGFDWKLAIVDLHHVLSFQK